MSKQWGNTRIGGRDEPPEEEPRPMKATMKSLGVSSQTKRTAYYREKFGFLLNLDCDTDGSLLELAVRQGEDGSMWVTLRTYERPDNPDEAPPPRTIVLFEGPVRASIAQAFALHFYARCTNQFAVDVLPASTPDDPFYTDDSVVLSN